MLAASTSTDRIVSHPKSIHWNGPVAAVGPVARELGVAVLGEVLDGVERVASGSGLEVPAASGLDADALQHMVDLGVGGAYAAFGPLLVDGVGAGYQLLVAGDQGCEVAVADAAGEEGEPGPGCQGEGECWQDAAGEQPDEHADGEMRSGPSQ